MLADFSKSPGLELKKMFKWLIPFKPLVSAGEVAKKMDKLVKLELTGKTWEKGVKKFIDPGITLKTAQLKGKTTAEAVENYVTRNKFDWVIIPKSRKESAKKLFPVDISKKLVKSIDKPVLLY
jgi:nucleotide-binding universal stress UspA family protein